jgi:hypothetical protein
MAGNSVGPEMWDWTTRLQSLAQTGVICHSTAEAPRPEGGRQQQRGRSGRGEEREERYCRHSIVRAEDNCGRLRTRFLDHRKDGFPKIGRKSSIRPQSFWFQSKTRLAN